MQIHRRLNRRGEIIDGALQVSMDCAVAAEVVKRGRGFTFIIGFDGDFAFVQVNEAEIRTLVNPQRSRVATFEYVAARRRRKTECGLPDGVIPHRRGCWIYGREHVPVWKGMAGGIDFADGRHPGEVCGHDGKHTIDLRSCIQRRAGGQPGNGCEHGFREMQRADGDRADGIRTGAGALPMVEARAHAGFGHELHGGADGVGFAGHGAAGGADDAVGLP